MRYSHTHTHTLFSCSPSLLFSCLKPQIMHYDLVLFFFGIPPPMIIHSLPFASSLHFPYIYRCIFVSTTHSHRFPHRHILRSLCVSKGTDSLKSISCQNMDGFIYSNLNATEFFVFACMTRQIWGSIILGFGTDQHTGITSHYRLRAAVNACTVITVCLCPFVLQCLL